MVTAYRTTAGITASRSLDNMQLAMQRLQDLQNKLSSGREISKPSDDPSGAVSAMSYRSDEKRTEQYSRNAQDGLGWLGTADNTLTSSLESLQRIRTLVLQGANGTTDEEARQALAEEVKTAKETLIGLANTTYLNRPIFAGTANPAGQNPPLPAYGDDGTYNGNQGAVFRSVGPDAKVQVNFDGPSIFGDPAADDLWNTLSNIEAHLRSGDPNDVAKLTKSWTSGADTIASDIDRLDAHRTNIQNRLSEIGARYHRVEQMQTRADDNLLTIKNALSEVENIDLAKTIMDLELQSVAYQASLSATARVIQPSLLDFLR
jgi:flagellar hook-associated protein 3 FlgL